MDIKDIANALLLDPRIQYYENIGLSFSEDYEGRKSTRRMVWFIKNKVVFDLGHLKIGLLGWLSKNKFGCGIYPKVNFLDQPIKKIGLTKVLGAPDPDQPPFIKGSKIKYLDEKGRLHRRDGRPALETPTLRQTYRKGKLHSYGIAPSEILISEGEVIELKWHNKGKLNRLDYPSVIKYDSEGRLEYEAYYLGGVLKETRSYIASVLREIHSFAEDGLETISVYNPNGKLKSSLMKKNGEYIKTNRQAIREWWSTRKDEFHVENTIKFLESSPYLPGLLKSAKTIMNYEDIPHTVPYRRAKDLIKTSLHNGQLKLFLTELRFLVECLPSYKSEAYMVYAGSAPSNKIKRLSDMFPNVKFILVDPHEHYVMYGSESQYDHPGDSLYFKANPNPRFAKPGGRIEYWENGRVIKGFREDVSNPPLPGNLAEIIRSQHRRFFIIEDYYSNKTSELLHPLTESGLVLFVSDIRTQFESDESPKEIDVLWNSAMMYNWVKILKPRKFMLKFRTPYEFSDVSEDYRAGPHLHEDFEECDIPFIKNHQSKKFVYIKPEVVYMQAFAGPTSTESRLVGSTLELQEWDIDEYNNHYFYYNRFHRAYGWHDHPTYRDLGVDRCGDCAIMVETFEMYRTKYSRPESVKKLISDSLKEFRRNLFDDSIHGYYFSQYHSVKELIDKQINYLDVVWVQIYRGKGYDNLSKNWAPTKCEKAKTLQRMYLEYPDLSDFILRLYILQVMLGKFDDYLMNIAIRRLRDQAEYIFETLSHNTPCSAREDPMLMAVPPSHISEIESPALAVYLDTLEPLTLVTLSAHDIVCGRSSDANFFEHNIFSLPEDARYVIYVDGIDLLLKIILTEKLRKSGSEYVLIEVNQGSLTAEDFIIADEVEVYQSMLVDSSKDSQKGNVVVKSFLRK